MTDYLDPATPAGTPLDRVTIDNAEHLFAGGVTTDTTDGAFTVTSGQGYSVSLAPGKWVRAEVAPGHAAPEPEPGVMLVQGGIKLRDPDGEWHDLFPTSEPERGQVDREARAAARAASAAYTRAANMARTDAAGHPLASAAKALTEFADSLAVCARFEDDAADLLRDGRR